jgi:hypothetical protein
VATGPVDQFVKKVETASTTGARGPDGVSPSEFAELKAEYERLVGTFIVGGLYKYSINNGLAFDHAELASALRRGLTYQQFADLVRESGASH